MGGNNLLQVLLAAVKSRITPIVTKLKLIFSVNFIRTRIVAGIRKFLVSLFNVKPRDKNDYYGVFGWLISRRLAFAVVVAVGVLSVAYILTTGNFVQRFRTGMKSYSYRSIVLRFTSGQVRIRGKGGYTAYEGNVEKGSVTGTGTLYNRDGIVVYQGNFEKNKYEGKGTQYFSDGKMEYSGDFSQNLYEGEGKLYRENGSLEYDGDFSLGKKEGTGNLHDNGSNLIYTGAFSNDELVYSNLLGAGAAEVAEAYKGRRITYAMDDDIIVVMEDIDAIYLGEGNPDALDDETSVAQVIVLKDTFPAAGGKTVEELRKYFGSEIYQGTSEITLQEAIAVGCTQKNRPEANWTVDVDADARLDDYFEVQGWDSSKEVYIRSFQKDGLIYNFISQDNESPFVFYTIEQEGGTGSE